MTITMTKHNHEENKEQIRQCLQGEMCKILKRENAAPGTTEYIIDTNILSGWPFLPGSAYHGTNVSNGSSQTGLGVFALLSKADKPDGGCTLEFTEDLNANMP